MKSWNIYFKNIAEAIASKAKDTTKVGAVIVGPNFEIRSTGWNGFSRKVEELPERCNRPEKYRWTVHAEANAIYNAARAGVSTEGTSIYTTHYPCLNCADAIIQAGIITVYVSEGTLVGDHGIDISRQKFEEAGVKVIGV